MLRRDLLAQRDLAFQALDFRAVVANAGALLGGEFAAFGVGLGQQSIALLDQVFLAGSIPDDDLVFGVGTNANH